MDLDTFLVTTATPNMDEMDLRTRLSEDEMTELCETGSVTVLMGNRRRYVVALSFTEEQS